MRVRLKTSARRRLMAGAAVLGALAAPGAASATCVAATSGAVTCATTTTTNVVDANAVTAVSSDNEYTFNSGVPVIGTVSSGATITGVGLWFEQDSLGQTLSVVNNGSVTNGIPGNGLEGLGDGALLTYTGNGAAIAPDVTNDWSGLFLANRNGGDIQVGSAATPITGTFTGTAGLYAGWRAGFPDVPGNISIYLAGGHVTGLATSDADFGVFADTEPGAGNIFVQTTGNTTFTGSAIGFGLHGHSGTGNVSLITNATFGSASAVLGEAINATVTSGAGWASVTENGGASWSNFYGVRAEANGNGTVSATVDNGTQITVTGNGTASGVRTDALTGITTVSLTGLGTSIAATQGYGLYMDSTSGGLVGNIGAGVTLSGLTAGIFISTTSGPASLTNDGVLNASTMAGGVAIAQTGGSLDLANLGSMYGRLSLGGVTGVTSFTNSGLWRSSGLNSFGTGPVTIANQLGGVVDVSHCGSGCDFDFAGNATDTVNNAGTFDLRGRTGDQITFNFNGNGADSFNNSGVVNVRGEVALNGLAVFDNQGGLLAFDPDCIDDDIGVVRISGDFVGGTGSRIALNAFLGGPDSNADQVDIGGNLRGLTSLVVNDTNAGLGGYTGPTGIRLITVGGSSATATLRLDDSSTVIGGHYLDLGSSGVLVKGLFDYTLTDVPGGYALVSVPGQGLSETPFAITGARSLWYQTATDWDERQMHLRTPGVSPDGTVGVWLNPIGSWSSRIDQATAVNGEGSLPVDLSYHQDTYGLIGGADFGWSHVNDSLRFGVLGGYVSSNLDFHAGGGVDYSGGLVGATATWRSGGFFASALGKVDLLRFDMGGLDGFSDASGQAVTWGGLGSFGYHLPCPSGRGFIEPIATLAGTSTSLGGFDLHGEGVGVDFDHATTFRGALGLRGGLTFADNPGGLWTASAMARVWQPFLREQSWASITNPGLPFDISDRFSSAFGDVSGRLDYVSKRTGLSAGANLGVKFAGGYSDVTAGAELNWRW